MRRSSDVYSSSSSDETVPTPRKKRRVLKKRNDRRSIRVADSSESSSSDDAPLSVRLQKRILKKKLMSKTTTSSEPKQGTSRVIDVIDMPIKNTQETRDRRKIDDILDEIGCASSDSGSSITISPMKNLRADNEDLHLGFNEFFP